MRTCGMRAVFWKSSIISLPFSPREKSRVLRDAIGRKALDVFHDVQLQTALETRALELPLAQLGEHGLPCSTKRSQKHNSSAYMHRTFSPGTRNGCMLNWKRASRTFAHRSARGSQLLLNQPSHYRHKTRTRRHSKPYLKISRYGSSVNLAGLPR